MKIGLIFPHVSAPTNGISDHSTALAQELRARGHEVLLVGAGETRGPISFAYVNGWPSGDLRNTRDLVGVASSVDTILLQFEQFSYGHRGYNPEMSRFFDDVAAINRTVTKVIYFHETYAAPRSAKHTIMHLYQKQQARRLARSADVALHSCAMGYARLSRFNPRSAIVPVHENIAVARETDDWTAFEDVDQRLRVLVFGGLEKKRAGLIKSAFAEIKQEIPDAVLWYVGKNAQAARFLTERTNDLRIWEAAAPRTVSRLMIQADLALSPFPDGVSGRRGSFAALMKHGVPTISNIGRHTDEYLRTGAALGAFSLHTDANFAAGSLRLAKSADIRARMHDIALQYFQFIPSVTASALAVENLVS